MQDVPTRRRAASPLDELDADALSAAEEAVAQEAWDRTYEADRSWEELQEDETGRLRPADPTAGQRVKRKRLLDAAASARIRRGMIRYLLLAVDMSCAAAETDMRPSRIAVLAQLAPAFIRQFFAQNPLSQLGIMACRGGVAERVTELSGAPEAHIAALKRALRCDGDLSLQNMLEQATASLARIPPYGSRELCVLQSALTTCDPGNVHAAIAAAKKARVRVSVVSLAAEVHVARRARAAARPPAVCKPEGAAIQVASRLLRQAAEETGGSYGVSLDAEHLEQLLMAHAPPPPALADETASSLVLMGFPQRSGGVAARAAVMFAAGAVGGEYVCPRCKARCAELPGACPACRMTLVSSPQLARSYHHLFPAPPFAEERAGGGATPSARCFGCRVPLGSEARGVRLRCGRCGAAFCFECDLYVHERLHNCPRCCCVPGTASGE